MMMKMIWPRLILSVPTVDTTVLVKKYRCVCVPPTRLWELRGLSKYITLYSVYGLPMAMRSPI